MMTQQAEIVVSELAPSPRMSLLQQPLRLAYFWLLLFSVVNFARPEDWIPGLTRIPLAKITGILAFVALVFAIGKVRHRFARESIYLLLLFGQLCLTVPFSPVWRGGAFQGVLDFSKVVVISMVMVLAVRTVARLRYLLFVQAASVAIVAVVSVWKGRYLGGRLEGVLSGSYGNSNDLALTIVVSLPLCLVFLFGSRSKLRKTAWAMAMLTMIYAVFLTSSRGGLISLIVVTALCLWEFAVRGRRRYLVAVVAIAGIVFSLYAAQGVMSRLSAKDESAALSAEQRRELLIKSLKVTAQHPLFGVGPGNFFVVSGNWHVSHNSYTQMSSEGGLPALVLYLLILWRGFANVRSVKRMTRRAGELGTLASAFRASLVGFVVGSFFASEAYQFLTYFLVFYTTILYQIASREWRANRDNHQDVADTNTPQKTESVMPEQPAWSTY
jgi:O-antigen ligase